ncbi:MAG: hypothetical protein JW384_01762 [Nitrosomonadaceae bacterium]|nr:hypothetical protein [Nitrosomonadaceae bacterium]
MNSLHRLYLVGIQWMGVKKTLPAVEQRDFARWLCRVHPTLVNPFKGSPAVLRQQCREVIRALKPLTHKSLSMEVIHRYTQPLTTYYLNLPPPRPTFSHFLETVMKECLTEDALKRFLKLP